MTQRYLKWIWTLFTFCCYTMMYGQSQTFTVTGVVTSAENGEGIPGVNVTIKGATIGTITDVDGKYSILTQQGSVLVFSSVGFISLEVAVKASRIIDISLETDKKALEEVIVVGYGEQSKRKITSSISSIKKEVLQDQISSNLDNLLQGRASGVQVIQNNGAPGAGITVRIRGNSTIGGGNEPLYVVDGVPIKSGDYSGLSESRTDGVSTNVSALADINPADIESIEILKDAAAASIYGARASNGVVLITTKKGQQGDLKLNIDLQTGVQSVARFLPVTNARQTREIGYEAWVNAGRLDAFEHFTDSLNPNYNHDTHWQKELFKSGITRNVNLSAEGGSEKAIYAVTGSYLRQEGTIPNSDYTRYSTRLNLVLNNNARVRFGANLGYTRAINNRINDGEVGAGATSSGAFRGVLNNIFELQSPMLSPYDVDGNLMYGYNPIGTALATNNKASSNRVIGNFYAEADLWKGFVLKSSVGVDIMSMREQRFIPSVLHSQPSEFRQATARAFDDLMWINENTLSYRTQIQTDHTFSGLLGFSQQESRAEAITAQRINASTDKIITVNAGANMTEASSFIEGWALTSLFGRFNYSFRDKYMVQAALRRDGSSRFGRDTRFGTFPSLSLGWRLAGENFLQSVSFIQDLKLRASIGKTGNQEIPNYVAKGLMATGADYEGQAGIAHIANGLPNRALTWEKTLQSNIGLDITLIKGRLNLTADYYLKKTTDLLFSIPVPTTSGYSSLTTNLGELMNKGVEFDVNSIIVDQEFKWDASFNISFNRNRVISLPSGDDIMSTRYGVDGVIREGEPLGVFYGYTFEGVYSRSEDIPNGLRMNGQLVAPGDAIFTDRNGDNIIDINDRTIIGNANPLCIGGFSNRFGFRGLELVAFFNYSYGNDILNEFRAKRDDMARAFSVPSPEIYYNRWRKEGDVTDVPKVIQGDPRQNGRKTSTRWLENGSFLRLKTVTLSYNLPKILTNRAKLSKARIYVTGQNLLTLTKYTGYDPEVASTSNFSRGVFGVDVGSYPISKAIIVGLNIGL